MDRGREAKRQTNSMFSGMVRRDRAITDSITSWRLKWTTRYLPLRAKPSSFLVRIAALPEASSIMPRSRWSGESGGSCIRISEE